MVDIKNLSQLPAPAPGGFLIGAETSDAAFPSLYPADSIASVSVKSFGAVGDGVTDDQPAISAAIAYMRANNIVTLFFPDGTYFLGSSVSIVNDTIFSLRLVGTSMPGFAGGSPFGGTKITGIRGAKNFNAKIQNATENGAGNILYVGTLTGTVFSGTIDGTIRVGHTVMADEYTVNPISPVISPVKPATILSQIEPNSGGYSGETAGGCGRYVISGTAQNISPRFMTSGIELFKVVEPTPISYAKYSIQIENIHFDGDNRYVYAAFANYVGAGPARPINIYNCDFTGFYKALVCDLRISGNPVNTSWNTVNIIGNGATGNQYFLWLSGDQASNGFNISGNVIEGNFNGIYAENGGVAGGTNISDNQLEGQPNPIVIMGGLVQATIERNYFEANSGWLMYITTSSSGSQVDIGPNFFAGTALTLAKVFLSNGCYRVYDNYINNYFNLVSSDTTSIVECKGIMHVTGSPRNIVKAKPLYTQFAQSIDPSTFTLSKNAKFNEGGFVNSYAQTQLGYMNYATVNSDEATFVGTIGGAGNDVLTIGSSVAYPSVYNADGANIFSTRAAGTIKSGQVLYITGNTNPPPTIGALISGTPSTVGATYQLSAPVTGITTNTVMIAKDPTVTLPAGLTANQAIVAVALARVRSGTPTLIARAGRLTAAPAYGLIASSNSTPLTTSAVGEWVLITAIMPYAGYVTAVGNLEFRWGVSGGEVDITQTFTYQIQVPMQQNFAGYISGTALTVTTVPPLGGLAIGQRVFGAGVNPLQKITGGSGINWTVSAPQTLGSSTNPVSLSSVNAPSFTGYISGTTLTIDPAPAAGEQTVLPGMLLFGPGVLEGQTVVSGSLGTWTVSQSQTLGSAGSKVTMTAATPVYSYIPYAGPLYGQNTAVTPGGIANNASVTATVTVTGAALGDIVDAVSFSLSLAGVSLSGYVSAANTVTVVFSNNTGALVTLGTGTVRVTVTKLV